MKISKKILTALGAVGLLSGSAAAITSCACTRNNIEAGVTDVSIVGNARFTYFEFTLNSDLDEGQTLTCNAESTDYFVFSDLIITNKIVSLPVVWALENAAIGRTYKQDITFTCKNKDGSSAWEQTIKDCTVTYSPNLILTSTSKMVTETLSEDRQTMTGVYTFKLGEELANILELKPFITNGSSGYSIDYTNTKVEVNGKDVTFTLVVKRETTIGTGDKFAFDLQFECVVIGHPTWSYWQSNMFSNMSMSYDEKEIAIDETDFETKKITDPTTGVEYERLIGIKSTSKAWNSNAGYNTLSIPAKSAKRWIREIGDGTNPINLPTTVKKIKIEGIGVQKFNEYCFYGNTNIKYFDVSCITDDVQSLDTLLEFKTNSLGGWTQSGHIIWNPTISQYKKHMVKEKLYYGGLENSEWFGIIKVKNITQLREAAAIGGTIELQNDIAIAADENFTGQVNFYNACILDLNGKTIEVTERPIFNTPKAEFAAIGVWDCELLVCDSSANHDGCIKTYDCSPVHSTSPMPKQPPEDPTKDPGTNKYWEWLPDSKEWRIRENRTFYCRSDIPTRAKGTLEILGGKFWGNCTCVMNWNTTVYIEDGYIQADESTPDTYKGTYAPEFHLYSRYCSPKRSTQLESITDPCQEMLNCKQSTAKSGEATFQVWGGKYFGSAAYDPKVGPMNKFFHPDETADEVPKYDGSSGYDWADWTYNRDYPLLPYSVLEKDKYTNTVYGEDPGYILAIPGDLYWE